MATFFGLFLQDLAPALPGWALAFCGVSPLLEFRLAFSALRWQGFMRGHLAILIVLAVLGFNFVGDGLRDAMDPKSKK